jgi:pyrroloquinoline quinone biosynthesis protein B
MVRLPALAAMILLLAPPWPRAQEAAPPAAAGDRFELFVLGRMQDGGLPHLGCDAACCASARAEGRIEHPACLGIHDRRGGGLILLEATPGIEAQAALLHRLTSAGPRGRRPVDAILVTHAHVGHYAGLAHLGREVAATSGTPLFVTPRLAAFLRGNGPWSQLVELDQVRLVEVAPGTRFMPLDGLSVEAIPVPHREEFSDTVAFRIRGPHRTVLFCPDVDRWSARDGLLESLLEGVDVAYLDGTFYDGRELPGRDLSSIPHPPMIDTMERLSALAAARPGRIRFIHLNHTNPALRDAEIGARLEDRGFRIAAVGERVGL